MDDHEAFRDGLGAWLREEPDVALVDTDLPDGSGIDLTRELLERRPGLGVILYTGDSDPDKLYTAFASGARGYALKGGSVPELVGAIERIAAGGSYVDGRLDQILLSPCAAQQFSRLSPREREIMRLTAEGLTAGPVAKGLNVWVETVRDVIRKLLGRKR